MRLYFSVATSSIWCFASIAGRIFRKPSPKGSLKPIKPSFLTLARTIYQTHAIATQDFIKIGGAKVEGTVLAAGGMLVFDEMLDANPVKSVAARFIKAYEKIYGSRPATFGANTYDSGILLQYAVPDALKKGKPGTEAFRSALRDSLETQKDIVGAQGVFNITLF